MSNMYTYMLDIQHKIKSIKPYIPIKLQFYGNWKITQKTQTPPKQLISLHIVNHAQNSLVLVCGEEAGVPVSFIPLLFK